MGGSQLKKLKATLQASGLIGQTNVKKGKKGKNSSIESRRDAKEKLIEKIRDDFNPFEKKYIKNKHDIQERNGDAKRVSRPGVTKQIGEQERKSAYELKKSRKNKTGALIDRRFGENDSSLTAEEKMLERFTKEKQKTSSKRSLFNLDDDDEDDEEISFTHLGESLANKFDDGDLGIGEKRFHDEADEENEEKEARPRKKTKAEVMKEVIAKSKFYKHERQKQQAELENQVQELNEDYDDVLSELRAANSAAAAKKKNSSDLGGKTEKDLEYSQKIRQLTLERRAAPADRTKTDEELEKERTEAQKKLEKDRLRRMEGLDREEGVADDLDENEEFWARNSDEEANEEDQEEDEEEEEEEEEVEGDEKSSKKSFKNKSISTLIKCPETHEEFLNILDNDHNKSVITTRTIINKYKPNLAPGNKEKVGNFAKVIFEHILHLADSDLAFKDYDKYVEIQEELIKVLKKLSAKYILPITEFSRDHISELETNFSESKEEEWFKVSNLLFFTIVGVLFSTSDHYHLVVTPSIIFLCQSINQTKVDSLNKLFYGLFVCELLTKYQRISKRYIPEVTLFLEQSLTMYCTNVDLRKLTVILPEFKVKCEEKIDDSVMKNSSLLKISDLKNTQDSNILLVKVLEILEQNLDIWKSKESLIEVTNPFLYLLSTLPISKDCSFGNKIQKITDKILNLRKFSDHKPLTLQSHRPVAIATYAPKYEDNFNPEKKSYDTNVDRQEMNKLKAQIKKEKKLTVKELRRDNKFMARESIKETKTKYSDYHKKMASIVNSINTIEGGERNQYDKERRIRKSKNKK